MAFPEAVFRAYDIRGIGGKEITPEFMRDLGRAFVLAFDAQEVVVGYDARPSSKDFLPHLLEGITMQGADVCLVGMVPSELVIATAGLNHIKNAAIITASHNPAEYVGVKLYKDESVQVAQINDQAKVKEIAMTGNFPTADRKGEVRELDPWPGYIDHVCSLVDRKTFQPRHILVDAGNGMGGAIIEHLAPKLNLTVDKLYFEPDGTYPNHVPNPIVPATRQEAEAKAKAGKYDFTLLFDGDADRIIFLDEKGDYISGDFTGTLIADEIIQKKYPGTPVVIDLRRGWVLQDSAKQRGYEAIVTMAGNPYLKKAMRESTSVYGFEASAHNFYKDFFMADTSGTTLIYVLDILESTGKPLSELIAPYRQGHYMTDEINFEHHNAMAAIDALIQHFADAHVSRKDGLSLETPEWHANLRTSNTEPLIRLNLEAHSETVLAEKAKELEDIITASGGHKVDH